MGSSRRGVKILEQLGVTDRLLEVSPPIEDGVIAFDDMRIEVRGVARILGAPMLNVRRLTLDAILARRGRGCRRRRPHRDRT